MHQSQLGYSSRNRPAARQLVSIAGWMASLAVMAALVAVILLFSIPRLLGVHGVIVLSGSMEPALETGAILFIKPNPSSNEIEVGDVITFSTRRQALVTHRVVDVIDGQSRLFRTKGDANEHADVDLVSVEQVIGKATFNLPYIGYAADFLSNRENYYLLVGIPALLLIVSELFVMGREIRTKVLSRAADNRAG